MILAVVNEIWCNCVKNCGFICSRERDEWEWCIWNKSYMNCGIEIKWRMRGSPFTWFQYRSSYMIYFIYIILKVLTSKQTNKSLPVLEAEWIEVACWAPPGSARSYPGSTSLVWVPRHSSRARRHLSIKKNKFTQSNLYKAALYEKITRTSWMDWLLFRQKQVSGYQTYLTLTSINKIRTRGTYTTKDNKMVFD